MNTLKIHDLWERRAKQATDRELAFLYVHFRRRSHIASEGENPYSIKLILGGEVGRRPDPPAIVREVTRLKGLTTDKFEVEFWPVSREFYERVP